MSENTWFTGDTHFWHVRMAEQWRHFSSVEEMNEVLIERWNEVVKPEDRIYFLGDFSFANKGRTNEIISRLHGQIHMIWGNHDRTTRALGHRFTATHDYHELKVADDHDQRLVLFHYPILSFHNMHHGAWHLHGHSHSNLPEDPEVARMDVGADTHNLTPWHYEEIAEHLRGRRGVSKDYHDHHTLDRDP